MEEKRTGAPAFTIAKTEPDKMLVFGWGSVAVDADGTQIEDLQGDMIDPEDLEKAAYDHVLNFRSTGERHDPRLRRKGRLVESCVFTKEKQAAIGIPPGTVPEGWWVGYKIDDPEAWEKIKSGEYQSFSVEGKGERTPIEKAQVAKSYAELRKYNPYHDERGRFASANGFRTYSADRRIKQPWGENNSLMAHMDPDTGTVSRERAALYNRIINKYLEGVEPPADGKPTLDYMGGGGGSGKSYTISQGVVQVPGKGKAVQINSDDIKMEIPEFRQRAASDDEALSKGAANYVHEESSKITKYLTQAAMAKGLNIVIDGVASDPEKLSQEIKAARDGGYSTVRAHYVATPTEIALAASRSRYSDNPNKEERRYVPDDVILEAHKKVSANFPALSELFDSVEVVQNDRSSPVRRIAYKERGGEMQVTDQAAYQAFLDKGK